MFARVALALVVATGGFVVGLPTSDAALATGRPVVLVLVRDLSWGEAPPALDGYAKANLAMRTAEAHGTAADGYLSIGKGAPSEGLGVLGVGRVTPTSHGGLALADWPQLRDHDGSLHQPGRLGTLGETLRNSAEPWSLVTDDPAAAATVADLSGTAHRVETGGGPAVAGLLSRGARTVVVATAAGGLPQVVDAAGPVCVLVASVSTPDEGRHLGVLAASPACGLGTQGLRSPALRQGHLAALGDVVPTYLSLLGIPQPQSVRGRVVKPAPAVTRPALEARPKAVAADTARSPLVWLFVALSAVGAAVAVARPSARAAVGYAMLAVPAAGFLIMFVPWWRWGIGGPVLAGPVFGGAVLAGSVLCGLLGLGAAVLGRRDVRLGIGALALLVATVVATDALFGGPLEVDAPFGNSPVIGGRFYGVGNIGAGFLAAAVLVAGALALERWGRSALAPVALGIGVALVLGAPPWFGADVGAALAFVPAYGVLLLGWRDGRVSLGRVLLAAAGAVAVVGAFAIVDVAVPGSARSHLGGAVAGGGGLSDQVVRKADRALGSIKSPIALLIPVGAIALALVRPKLGLRPALRAGAWALLVAGLAGSLLNDSGLVVGAAVMAIAWPAYTAVTSRLGRQEPPEAPRAAPAGVGVA